MEILSLLLYNGIKEEVFMTIQEKAELILKDIKKERKKKETTLYRYLKEL